MRGASAGSLAAATERIQPLLGHPLSGAVGEELFAVARLLDGSAALRRALTDPNAEGKSKAGLSNSLLAGKVSGTTVDLLGGMVRSRWSGARELADACEVLGVQAVLGAAEQDGALENLEDELFRFGRIVAGDPQLRAALTNRSAPAQAKSELVQTLLEGRASAQTLSLARQAAAYPRGRRLEQVLEEMGRAVAERRDRAVATVTTAIPLTQEQRSRLAAALHRVYGRTMHLNVDLDPSVIGGLRIQVADEVIDASVVSRLAIAGRLLAGQ